MATFSLLDTHTIATRVEVRARRLRLEEAINSLLPRFTFLPFDEFAARTFVQLAEKARRAGHSVSIGDAWIVAIAHCNGIDAISATRDHMTTPTMNPSSTTPAEFGTAFLSPAVAS